MKATEQSAGLRGNLAEACVKHRKSISFVEFAFPIDIEFDVRTSRGLEPGFELTYKTHNSIYRTYEQEKWRLIFVR